MMKLTEAISGGGYHVVVFTFNKISDQLSIFVTVRIASNFTGRGFDDVIKL